MAIGQWAFANRLAFSVDVLATVQPFAPTARPQDPGTQGTRHRAMDPPPHPFAKS